MPTTVITNLDRTRLKDILSHGASYEQRFLYLAISALLESQVGAGTTDAIIDSLLPASPTTMGSYAGRKLVDYSGLSRTRIKLMKNVDIEDTSEGTLPGELLTDDDVDAIFTAIGVVE